MQAYKIIHKDDKDYGRILIPVGQYELLKCATPTLPQHFINRKWLEIALREGVVVGVDILEEKWVHPHLAKFIKKELFK